MSERDSAPHGDGGTGKHELLVYAMRHCPGWHAANGLATLVRLAGIARLEVRLVDLSEHADSVPDFVVASPTWTMDGRRLALGNPDPDWLLARVASLVEGG